MSILALVKALTLDEEHTVNSPQLLASTLATYAHLVIDCSGDEIIIKPFLINHIIICADETGVVHVVTSDGVWTRIRLWGAEFR